MGTKIHLLSSHALVLVLALITSCAMSPVSTAQESPQPSVEIIAEDSIPLRMRETLLVTVQSSNFRRAEVRDVLLAVRIGDRDITAQVVRGQDTAFNSLGEETRSGSRFEFFELDLPSEFLQPGVQIQLIAGTSLASGGLLQSSMTMEVDGSDTDENYCIKGCWQTFVDALGVVKHQTTGKVTLGNGIAGGLDGDRIRDAVGDLRSCLLQCNEELTEMDSTLVLKDANGNDINVDFDLESNGDTSTETSTGADLVIAIGGDAAAGSSAAGGAANATNSSGGGTSLAVAGTGGNNQNSPGAGGNARAVAKAPVGASDPSKSGDSWAVGGDGGSGSNSGGDGGDALAATKCPAGTAHANGGDGGDPVNNAAAGGEGGDATAENGTQSSSTLEGAPNGTTTSVPPGSHGGGATNNKTGLTLPGSTAGALIPNS